MRVYLSHLAKELMFWGTVVLLAVLAMVLVFVIQHKLSAEVPEETVWENPTSTNTQSRTFSDVDISTDAGKAMHLLVSRRIMSGYEDGTLRPTEQVKRVEALKMILTMSPIESNDIEDLYARYISGLQEFDTVIYKDIPKDAWFAPFVYKAYRLGMISGSAGEEFHAYLPVNLAEALKMLLVMEREQFTEADDMANPFYGVGQGEWYTRYFERAKKIGLLPLYEGMVIEPLEPMTRADLAMLLVRYLELREKDTQLFHNTTLTEDERQREKSYLKEELEY